jgi:hypothetical protein
VLRNVACVLAVSAGITAARGDVRYKPAWVVAEMALTAGVPRVHDEFELTVSLIPLDTMSGAAATITVPPAFEVLSGQLNRTADLVPGDTVELAYVLRAVDSGAFRVDVTVSPQVIDSAHWEEGASLYIIASTDTGFVSDSAQSDFLYNVPDDDEPLPPISLAPIVFRVFGQVKYKNHFWVHETRFDPLPGVEIVVVRSNWLRGEVVARWNTDAEGCYDYSFTAGPGSYSICVMARNSAGQVHGFLGRDAYRLASVGRQVAGDADVTVEWRPEIYGNPDGWYLEDACRMLYIIGKAKSWCLDSLHVTRDFVNVIHPLAWYLGGTWYVPKAFWEPTANPLIKIQVPGTDVIHLKEGYSPDYWQGQIYGPYGSTVLSHEWAHSLMMNSFCDVVPLGLVPAIHDWEYVMNPGFAFAEGFADWLGPAIWLDQYGQEAERGTRFHEDYKHEYGGAPPRRNEPWYKGPSPAYSNTDGRTVEGAVMGFLWDLFDSPTTPDHTPGVDDDGLAGNCVKIGDALSRIREDLQWMVIFNWFVGESPGPFVKFGDLNIDKFRSRCNVPCNETYSVNFFGTKPPAPQNLSAQFASGGVLLTWTDRAQEEGQYLVFRRVGDEPEYSLRAALGPNSHAYTDDEVLSGVVHRYKVAAVTCDTSDFAAVELVVPSGWTQRSPIPAGTRPVKDGAWLVYNSGNSKVYASKGNKCDEFYGYNPQNKLWTPLAVIPPGDANHKPTNGAAGCADGYDYIYATKGNNTQEFYRYDIGGNAWTRMHDVPLGPSNKRVKRGTDMVLAYKDGVGHPYLLKGYKSEFWRYHPDGDTWHQLADAPHGANEKWDKGSWLAYDDVNNKIYAHKAKYHEFYAYDVATDSWGPALPGMPVSGSAGSKKSKDGGCGAYADGAVCALKGGNTQEFWQYNIATNSWLELDTIPKGLAGKKVRNGADIAAATGFGLFALKGNKCNQFWFYKPAPPGGTDAGFARSVGQPPGQDLGETAIAEGIPASQPRWSPSGFWVTYTKEPAQGQNSEQVFMAPYGLQQFEVQLTDLPGDCESPSFAPGGGQWICFAVEDSSTGRLQIAKVPATSVPQPVVMLTAGNQDKWNPEWSPSGQAIIAQGDDASGSYSQLWLIPANGGPATMLTSGPCDHEEPAFLNPFEVVYLRSPDNGDDQLYKLNLVTMQETPLTFPPLQPERPCPSYDGSYAAYQAQNDAGVYQIGRVSSNGGDAHFLTADMFDQEEPDVSPDNVSVHSVRWVGLTSQICRVDAVYGGFLPITDASAIRDNPDSYWNPTSPYNLVVYEREDTSSVPPGFGQKPRPRKGTGVFLARSRRLGDGQMAAGNFVFALEKAQPNPAHDKISIRWMVPVEAEISLCVYNTAGQLVRVLVDGRTKPGAYTSVWNGTDARGRRLANGVYFYALDNGTRRISRKLVLTD